MKVDTSKKWPPKRGGTATWIRLWSKSALPTPQIVPPPPPAPTLPESDINRTLRLAVEKFVLTLILKFHKESNLIKQLKQEGVNAEHAGLTYDDPKYSITFGAIFQKGGPPAKSVPLSRPYYKRTRLDGDVAAQALAGDYRYRNMTSVKRFLLLRGSSNYG